MFQSIILIIGAGVSGLIAGIELAKSVILLEKHSCVGGQCKTEILTKNNDT